MIGKHIERAWLLFWVLPRSHQALGRQVYGTDDCERQFSDEHRRIMGLIQRVATLRSPPTAARATGIMPRIKEWTKVIRQLLQAQVLEFTLAHAYGTLGRAAYDTNGENIGTPGVIARIRLADQRFKFVNIEIAGLLSKRSEGVLTVQRLAVGIVLIAGLVFAASVAATTSHRTSVAVETPQPDSFAIAGRDAPVVETPRLVCKDKELTHKDGQPAYKGKTLSEWAYLALRHKDASVRSEATKALGRMGPAAIPTLVMLLQDREVYKDGAITFAFRKIGPAAVPALAVLAEDRDQKLRSKAILLLGPWGRMPSRPFHFSLRR